MEKSRGGHEGGPPSKGGPGKSGTLAKSRTAIKLEFEALGVVSMTTSSWMVVVVSPIFVRLGDVLLCPLTVTSGTTAGRIRLL